AVEGWRRSDGYLDVLGDGSGGNLHPAAFSENAEAPQEMAGIVAGMPGPRQTVPRSELFAFILALRCSVFPLRHHADNGPLVQGWARRRRLAPQAER
ncbi:unnamed protein product, partial [Prorocentrum cordatum]